MGDWFVVRQRVRPTGRAQQRPTSRSLGAFWFLFDRLLRGSPRCLRAIIRDLELLENGVDGLRKLVVLMSLRTARRSRTYSPKTEFLDMVLLPRECRIRALQGSRAAVKNLNHAGNVVLFRP